MFPPQKPKSDVFEKGVVLCFFLLCPRVDILTKIKRHVSSKRKVRGVSDFLPQRCDLPTRCVADLIITYQPRRAIRWPRVHLFLWQLDVSRFDGHPMLQGR